MRGKGLAVGWVPGSEGSHVIGVRVELKCKEQGEVVFDDVPKMQILGHQFLRAAGFNEIARFPAARSSAGVGR